MGPNQTKSISMGPIWNTSGTKTVISVPVSVLGPERAGTEMGCIQKFKSFCDLGSGIRGSRRGPFLPGTVTYTYLPIKTFQSVPHVYVK